MINHGPLKVGLGERSYDIVIGPGLLARAGQEIAERLKSRDIRIVADSGVARIYMPVLAESLRHAGFALADPVIVPQGEASKGFKGLQDLCDALLASRLERSTLLVALGGGVVGDLTGFAAAALLRGLDFVQAPTTLLSQVDSSVGGKTGINATAGKNLIGAFHQPRLVLADTDTLNTLPRRELLSGYAEVVKHALIVDAVFFDYLEAHAAAMLAGDDAERAYAIRRSCEIKADIVTRDEKEHGDRALLNFGHTFGHAIEALTGYGKTVTHGEAVAIGMIMALDLSVHLGLCPAADRARVIAHYEEVGLPTRIEPAWNISVDGMIATMRTDKKNVSGRIRFVLSRGIGRAFVSGDVETADLATALGSCNSGRLV